MNIRYNIIQYYSKNIVYYIFIVLFVSRKKNYEKDYQTFLIKYFLGHLPIVFKYSIKIIQNKFRFKYEIR